MEVISSFFSNIKDKLTNPFFGTLIIVLLIHHWEFIYAIFNFDSSFTFDEKLEFLQNYISINITYKTLLFDLLYAAGAMIIGFIIIIITRSIVLLMEHNIMPWVTGKIISKNVVERSLYDDVVKEREDYFDQYEEQRKNVRDFSKTIDKQTEQVKEKDKNLLNQSNELGKALKEVDATNKQLSSTKKELNNCSTSLSTKDNSLKKVMEQLELANTNLDNYKNLYFSIKNEKFYSSIDKFPPEVISKVLELKHSGEWANFIELGNFFKNGGSMSGTILSSMIKRNIVHERDKGEDWTPLGHIIWNYRNIFNNIISDGFEDDSSKI